VAGWYTFRDTHHSWGKDDIPPILVLCPGEAEAEQWARALLASSDRREVPPLAVFLADVACALREGPLGPVWRRPDGSVRAHLCERLVWRPDIPAQVTASCTLGNPAAMFESTSKNGQLVREWAGQAVASAGEGSPAPSNLERLAALSVVTSPIEKRMLEWLGHHPLLSTDDLAVILRVSPQAAQRLLDNPLRYSLVDSIHERLEDEASASRRYFLTQLGLKLLAARDGVPPRRYARHGVVAAAMPGKQVGGRLQTLLRQLDHTVGVNRFFVRLIAEGAKGGPRLVRWLSASEAAQRFTFGDAVHWLRPDGAGDVYWQGRVQRFYLEWDRGTTRWPEMVEKLRVYAAFFAKAGPDGAEEGSLPEVLFVTTSPQREAMAWRCLGDAFSEIGQAPLRFRTSVHTLACSLGPLAEVWRTFGSSRRSLWLAGGGR
jgi:hypothetical protein